MSCVADKQKNVDKALRRIAEAASAGANVVCLQELFHGLYPCQSEDHARFEEAEPIPGPVSEALAGAAREHGVAIVGSMFERRAAGVYHNTAIVFDADGKTAGMYRKMHIPDDPNYYEKFYFTPGDLGFGAFDTRFGRLGPLVCWDQWYPEAARLSALARCADFVLSHRHRLAARRKGGIRRQPACRLGNHDAQPRHRQRRVCRGGESSGHRKRESNSGARRSWPIPMATCWPGRRTIGKKR